MEAFNASFSEAAESIGFRPALEDEPTSLNLKTKELNNPYDNIWYRHLELVDVKVVSLYEFTVFLELPIKDIFYGISDHSPVAASFEFD